MIAMSPTITLKGEMKFSMKKLIAGGHMAMSHFTGPGELLLAPHGLGDVTSIRLTGTETWTVGKDAFLACTERITKDYKAQNLSKMMFSGEGWWTYKIGGTGIIWITSLGAIIRKDVRLSLFLFLNFYSLSAFVQRGLTSHVTDRPGREIHCRQRPSGGLELQLHSRARRVRWHYQHFFRRRRLSLQVYGPWHSLHADEECASTGGVH
jgi:Mitochondrial biogenesis AIM24